MVVAIRNVSPACSLLRRHLSRSPTQAVAAEARTRELQEELTATYKEKSRLAEELVQASRQLQIVRDSNEAQVSSYLCSPPIMQG